MADPKPTTTRLAAELARSFIRLRQEPETDPALLRYVDLLADLVLLEADGAVFEFGPSEASKPAPAAPASEGR